ncbi:DUF397 domain-containing protein [Saccharothrix deserti]|uniref:DUF397 domain-containing protein n=1 Tax=Saccharothrix deserti TaxID=2593674 RepID=UPI00131E1F81|nr:DUF397 domain-containing protein [Saccharothrix deserti]
MTTTWSWRKSSRSATSGQCVEIGTSTDSIQVGVRDSKLGEDSPILTFTPGVMATFVSAAKDGGFDGSA